MKLLLIIKLEESQFFLLNALSNSIKSIFVDQDLSIDLFIISQKRIDDNFLFINKDYNKVLYSNNLKELIELKNISFDYLIAIENTILGCLISRLVKASTKASFKRPFGSFVFDKSVTLTQKKGAPTPTLEDLETIVKKLFNLNEKIKPKFYLENTDVRKSHEMIHWIFNTNYSLNLNQANYILLDLKAFELFKKNQIKMMTQVCNHLISKYKIKIIFISDKFDVFEKIRNSLSKTHRSNFINSKQNHKEVIPFFPIYSHAILIISNKQKNLPFLRLIDKPVYLIQTRKILLQSITKSLIKSKAVFESLTTRTIGEIDYILKSVYLK